MGRYRPATDSVVLPLRALQYGARKDLAQVVIMNLPRVGTKMISPRTNRTYKVVQKEKKKDTTLYHFEQVDGNDKFQMTELYVYFNMKRV